MKKYIFITIGLIILIIVCSYIFIKDNCIVTYCDEEYKCKTIEEKSKVNKLFNKYKDYKYVKVDKVINEMDIDKQNLTIVISNSKAYGFKYGLRVNDKVRLLSEEINSQELMDFKDEKIDTSALTYYAEQNRNVSLELSDFDNLKVFGTKSYYKDKDSKTVTKLENINGFNIKLPKDEDLDELIRLSAGTLLTMLNDNGMFTYGYYVNTNKKLTSYNILRHAGAIYSLIKYYEVTKNEELKEPIDLAFSYLIKNCLIKKNKNTYYVLEYKDNELKLGGNALAVLAMTEYQLAFNDSRYYDTAEKLANGILSMQGKEGTYTHVLNPDYSVKDYTRTTYYDGEATYALLNLYKLNNNKKYYDAAKKTIDMFVRQNYIQYKDQWVAYSMYNILQYDPKDEYIKFTLDNYSLNDFESILDFKPINLELLMNVYESYKYLLKNNKDNEYVKKFDIDKLKKSINYHKELLLKYYISDYYALYFTNPESIKDGFMSIEDDFRMRIDDIQHAISGLMMYSKMCKDK